MGETTNIEWCDSTANLWIGCTKVSRGCDNCYAERDWDLRKHRVQWGPRGARSYAKAGGNAIDPHIATLLGKAILEATPLFGSRRDAEAAQRRGGCARPARGLCGFAALGETSPASPHSSASLRETGGADA